MVNESGPFKYLQKAISKTTAEDFVATAKKYMDTVYWQVVLAQWDGIDSSGLT
jgi:predicted Zn-dependent peptidase